MAKQRDRKLKLIHEIQQNIENLDRMINKSFKKINKKIKSQTIIEMESFYLSRIESIKKRYKIELNEYKSNEIKLIKKINEVLVQNKELKKSLKAREMQIEYFRNIKHTNQNNII